MQICVLHGDWGNFNVNEIGKLLKNTASHLGRLLRTPFEGTIHVEPTPPNQPVPLTLYREPPDDPFVISLLPVTIGGVNSHTSSRTSSVMCYLTMRIWKQTRIIGSTKQSANLHPCSLSGGWLSDGALIHHTPIGRITRRGLRTIVKRGCLVKRSSYQKV